MYTVIRTCSNVVFTVVDVDIIDALGVGIEFPDDISLCV